MNLTITESKPITRKQGGVLSPYLLTRYVRDVIANIVQSCTGCAIGSVFTNCHCKRAKTVIVKLSLVHYLGSV